jgi:hypothetical protein
MKGGPRMTSAAEAVAGHHATLGNVEAELINPSGNNGCGCAYPDYIDDGTVELSNTIASRLRATGVQVPELVGLLENLPRYLVAEVAGHRIGVLHGDPESLAGWRLALEAMEPADPALRTDPDTWAGTLTTVSDVVDWLRPGAGGNLRQHPHRAALRPGLRPTRKPAPGHQQRPRRPAQLHHHHSRTTLRQEPIWRS